MNFATCDIMTLYGEHSLAKFAVAPMLDWTDRHCRFFHRLLTKKTLLYTEMLVADAAIHGNRQKLMAFCDQEHPIALQLGGADPQKLAEAAKVAADIGYDEVNLNVGCPSDRVQSGVFGACLMLEPELVAQAVEAMKSAVSIPITVKCRIGVDQQDSQLALDQLGDLSLRSGADAFWVHARKAWLKGLSPKDNRTIPPLDYQRVYRFKKDFPSAFVGLNGGVNSIEEVKNHLLHVDGVMMGRQAYHNPFILKNVDHQIFGFAKAAINEAELIEEMCRYIDHHVAGGGRVSQVTRHMVGLFHGRKGARLWRQTLSTKAAQWDATSEVLRQAFQHVQAVHDNAL